MISAQKIRGLWCVRYASSATAQTAIATISLSELGGRQIIVSTKECLLDVVMCGECSEEKRIQFFSNSQLSKVCARCMACIDHSGGTGLVTTAELVRLAAEPVTTTPIPPFCLTAAEARVLASVMPPPKGNVVDYLLAWAKGAERALGPGYTMQRKGSAWNDAVEFVSDLDIVLICPPDCSLATAVGVLMANEARQVRHGLHYRTKLVGV